MFGIALHTSIVTRWPLCEAFRNYCADLSMMVAARLPRLLHCWLPKCFWSVGALHGADVSSDGGCSELGALYRADLAALLCWVMGESCALMMLKMNCLEEATNATGGTAIERQGLEAPPLWS